MKNHLINQCMFIASLMLVGLLRPGTILAQYTQPGNFIGVQSSAERQVTNKINPLLKKYCLTACELLGVRAVVEEEVGEEGDLGFESYSEGRRARKTYISQIVAEIQVDESVTASNVSRLEKIIENHLRDYGGEVRLQWQKVQLPQVGGAVGEIQALKDHLESKVQKAIENVIELYCPLECLLSQINIEGRQIAPDLAKDYALNQVVVDKNTNTYMKIDDIDVEVTIDAKLDAQSRSRIIQLIRTKTRFVDPLNLNVAVTEFPESHAQKMERVRQESMDPYGLERLRQMLTLFRELAGTKEIITSNNIREELNSRETSKVSAKQVDLSQTENYANTSGLEYVMYIGGALVLAGLLIALFLRILTVNKDVKNMMRSVPGYLEQSWPRGAETKDYRGSSYGEQNSNNSPTVIEDKLKFKVENLRNEIIQTLIENTRVARETFGRILKEEGIEETAKYIKILGQVVVIELLDDPNLQRDLYSLSEFYHNSNFTFALSDEYDLLQRLKTKMTSSEIRVLTRKTLENFDFLSKLDAEQIFNLVSDETPQVQSIVLTQLDRKRRMGVFNMYQGASKISLMNELCKADAIPKEYLNNVALALGRKVSSRPEFDTQNLRSSEILVDLMERADLSEQRRIMGSLLKTNPEAARALKMRLVTVDMLLYLKEGHLLEIMLGMDRGELLAFLKGTREQIRDLLLSKAPPELAQSWVEDLSYMASVEDSAYRMSEMNILRRIRNLASHGSISILELNEMLYSEPGYLEQSSALSNTNHEWQESAA